MWIKTENLSDNKNSIKIQHPHIWGVLFELVLYIKKAEKPVESVQKLTPLSPPARVDNFLNRIRNMQAPDGFVPPYVV